MLVFIINYFELKTVKVICVKYVKKKERNRGRNAWYAIDQRFLKCGPWTPGVGGGSAKQF